ncbi:MAG: ABC transporter permease [Bacteroidales bacterium]|nr:ABC transporter permease [Bacteroidales bacterium]
MKLFLENIRISIVAIRSHMLRTILTILIIAFGIMALVGILTSIDAIRYFLTENFTMMGANTFTIRNRSMRIQIGSDVHQSRNYEPVTFDQAVTFKEGFDFPAAVSVHTFATHIATLKYGSEKTNPNVAVIGTDEDYLTTSGNVLEKGRNFSNHEIYYGSHVTIIGSELAKNLFKNNEDPVGKIISIGPGKYLVIGVLQEKGSSFGFSGDRNCLLPLNNVRQYFSMANASFTISVTATNPVMMETAIGEATGLFRIIRQTPLGMEDDFDISKSDKLVEIFLENIKYITLSATIIGLITLIGAAIGLMNIMLVSVTERTREIGIRKAMGATKKAIRNQFLSESIVIAQLGGIVGIVLGIGIGNILAMIIGSTFLIPWSWVVLGITLCFLVAVASGYLPANKAANLDPIESLRYE